MEPQQAAPAVIPRPFLRKARPPRTIAPPIRFKNAKARQAGLAPDRIPAVAAAAITPEQRLLQRATLGSSLYELEQIDRLGYQGYLNAQLNPEKLDDSELENALREGLPTLSMSAAEIYLNYPDDFSTGPYELLIATLYRALYSPRQLFESMVVFWSDHFNIDLWSDSQHFLKPIDDRDVIRRHAMGKFPDLLRASAHSPAMLVYLTNDSNYKDDPNQNYARELMELHCLGADNGYTQRDVEEVARCFTGWTLDWDEESDGFARFHFDEYAHDDGEKTVLGRRIPAGGGVQDGDRVLQILANHPNTARFLARKLLVYFWGYAPPQSYIDQIAAIYQRTGGNIRAMLRAILKRGWMATATPKLKRPFHLMVSALRAMFSGADDPYYLLDQLDVAGHSPFAWSPPNGYPDARGYWSGFLLPRWNFLTALLDPETSSVQTDLSYLDPAMTPQALTQQIHWLVSNGTLTESTQAAIRAYLRNGTRTPERIREALVLALSSPDFQDY
jgi:hypothetical protein